MKIKKVPIIPIKLQPTIDSFKQFKTKLHDEDLKLDTIWSGVQKLYLHGISVSSDETLLNNIQEEIKNNRFYGQCVGKSQQKLYQELLNVARNDKEELDRMYEYVADLLEDV